MWITDDEAGQQYWQKELAKKLDLLARALLMCADPNSDVYRLADFDEMDKLGSAIHTFRSHFNKLKD